MLKRTPKYFDGTQSPAKKLADLLPMALAEIAKKSQSPVREIALYWAELLGPQMSPLTELISFAEEVLTVKVKSATLYSLLSNNEKPRLLRELQKKFSVRNLVFRVG